MRSWAKRAMGRHMPHALGFSVFMHFAVLAFAGTGAWVDPAENPVLVSVMFLSLVAMGGTGIVWGLMKWR